jgi:hypothetical protein
MNPSTRFQIFIAALILIALIAVYVYYKQSIKKKRKVAELKEEYEKAIREKNKPKALELGRKYYSEMRGGILSIYDEQAITNDLSTF